MAATPLEELSTFKKKQAAMKAALDALYDIGGRVEAELPTHGRGGSKNATTVLLELVDEQYRSNPADTFNKLRAGGWIDAPVNGKRVPYVEMAIGLPWRHPRRPVTNEPTSTTEAAGSSADAEPTPLVEPVVPSAGVDADEADLGMRPGRLAARIEAAIPGIVAGAVERVLQEREAAQHAALGYWPTVPPETLETMQQQIVDHDRVMAVMRTTVEDVNEQNQRLSAMLNYLQDEVDAQRIKTNDYTPASKAMSVAKVPEFYRSIAREALRQGWTIQMTRGGHLAWRSPEGKVTFSGSTPTPNSLNVLTIKLLRLGLKIEGRSNERADVTQSGHVL